MKTSLLIIHKCTHLVQTTNQTSNINFRVKRHFSCRITWPEAAKRGARISALNGTQTNLLLFIIWLAKQFHYKTNNSSVTKRWRYGQPFPFKKGRQIIDNELRHFIILSDHVIL